MKVAFVGKGGSGKTSLSSLFIRHLAASDLSVLGIDADINQHLGAALGVDKQLLGAIVPIGERGDEVREYFRGTNERILPGTMIKTTPPGTGSQLVGLLGNDAIHEHFAHRVGHGIRLMTAGTFDESDLGVSCYHSKTGAIETYLGHLLDGPNEYVVVDMTAGADAFASGLCAKFDITFVVVEPTLKSLSVFRQYKEYADEFGIRICAVGNKADDQAKRGFLREHLGDDLVACFGVSSYVQSLERGHVLPFHKVDPQIFLELNYLHDVVDDTPQDWDRTQELARLFHRRNAEAWANDKFGCDLVAQIDPDFKMSPALLAA